MADFEEKKFWELEIPVPEPEVAAGISPWSKIFFCLTAGYALSLLSIPFMELDILLPLIGTLLLYLGYRSLRSENNWFRLGWYLALLRLLYMPLADSLMAIGVVQNQVVLSFYVSAPLMMLQLLLFYLGMDTFWRSRGERLPGGNPGTWMLGLYTVLYICAWIGWSGVLALVLLGGLAFVLVRINRAGRHLAERGCGLCPAPVRVTPGKIAVLYIAVSLVLIGCSCVAGSRISMEYQSLNKTTISAEARAAQQHLAGLGAPEALLEILAEKDLLALKEAELVQEVPMDAASAEFAGEKRSRRPEAAAYLFQLPEQRQYEAILFEWNEKPRQNWTETMSFLFSKVSPDAVLIDSYDDYAPHGRAVCEAGGETVCADFTRRNDPPAFAELDDIPHVHYGGSMQFSYPWFSQNWRGYFMVSYDRDPEIVGYVKHKMVWFHQTNPFVIPKGQMTEGDFLKMIYSFTG